MRRFEAAALVMVLILSCAVGSAAAYEVVAVENGGSVKGTVKFKGSAPAPEKVTIDKDEAVCGVTEKHSEALVVSADGGVKNAVAYLSDIKKGKGWADEASAVLDQNGCRFEPHVLVARAGGDVDMMNNDGILHNVHSYSEANKAFNIAQPKFKKKLTRKFEHPEFVKIVCDAHRWMNAYIVVADQPYYAVSDANGVFTLTDVPAGEYELKIWHETLAPTSQKVTVGAGGETAVSVELVKP